MKIEQFIRKLNNTELNNQNTNDAYVRISKEIQNSVPQDFFEDLDSNLVTVLNKKTKTQVDNWIRYQFYPSNDEYRIANLSSIYKSYLASPGDYVYIEKIQIENKIHYEIYMKTYDKICMKYSKSNLAFEILNESHVSEMDILEKNINLKYNGVLFQSKICFSHTKKKRADSPFESRYYTIDDLPQELINNIRRDSFVEVIQKGINFNIMLMNSWSFNKFIK